MRKNNQLIEKGRNQSLNKIENTHNQISPSKLGTMNEALVVPDVSVKKTENRSSSSSSTFQINHTKEKHSEHVQNQNYEDNPEAMGYEKASDLKQETNSSLLSTENGRMTSSTHHVPDDSASHSRGNYLLSRTRIKYFRRCLLYIVFCAKKKLYKCLFS